VAVSGTLDEATPDAERPDLYPGVVPSVWYRWTPAADGQFTLRLEAGEPGAVIEAFSGDTLAGLERIVAPSSTLGLVIDVKAGRPYAFAVSGRLGLFGLNTRFDPGAAADAFDDRTVISGDHFEILAGWRGPTLEPGEALPANYGSLWWSWTAPASGMLVMRATPDPVAGIGLPYQIIALTGDRLDRLGVAPIEPYFGQRVEAGQTYVLRLLYDYTALGSDGKECRVTFDLWPMEPNDNFAGRIVLVGDAVQFGGDDHVSWLEGGEPQHGLATSLWWEWTAPVTGTVQFQWESGDSGGAVRVFREDPFARPSVAPLPALPTVVQAGKTYYVCLGSPLVGGGQAYAVRGSRTWSLRLTPGLTPVRLIPGMFSSSTGMQLRLNGPVGGIVEISASADLLTWSRLEVVILEFPTVSWWDAVAAQEPCRFYRASLQF